MTSPDAAPNAKARATAARPRGPHPDDTSRRRPLLVRALFGLALAVVALAMMLATGEVALRLVYRGGGRHTLGGPGGEHFVHLEEGGRRGPFATGVKPPGTTRILVQGDSIAWGLGVRDWRDTFPNRLLDTLNRQGGRYDLALLAEPGHEIDSHLEGILKFGTEIQPDIIVYQWFVNDLEVRKNQRPLNLHSWQTRPWHQPLREWSYLYFFLDSRLAGMLPATERSYPQFILQHYAPGTDPWSEFLRLFHNWAVNAAHLAPRRLLLLYPQVPFRGTYPLEPVHERVKHMAGPHVYTIPAWTLRRRVGNSLNDPDSTYGVSRRLRAGEPGGWLFSGPGLAMTRGAHTVLARLRLDAPHTGAVGRLEVIQDGGQRILATRVLQPGDFPEVGAWTILDVPYTIDADIVQDVEFRFWAEDGVQVSADTLSQSVDYGLEVVDPIDELNTFDTHASIFDSHPNERAHDLLARVLADAISRAH